MEIAKGFIFQVDDTLVTATLASNNNYLVWYNENAVDKDVCVVYFSSNEIYYPNTHISFTRSILQKDKYEWRRNFITTAYKHIFVRDIQKQWYLEGINATVNTPEKLCELLRTLTHGFRVYMVGSSAGGFAAMLYGSLIKSERVYSFNAQLDLTLIMNGSNAFRDPILFKHQDDKCRLQYYSVANHVIKEVDYFYFQSAKSQMDINQYNSFPPKQLITRIPFKTSNHGFPFLRSNLPYMLSLNAPALKALAKKTHHPILFSIRIDGFITTFRVVVKTITDRIGKKIRECREAKH